MRSDRHSNLQLLRPTLIITSIIGGNNFNAFGSIPITTVF